MAASDWWVAIDDVIDLDDGSHAVIRPISSVDAEALTRFHAGLSTMSIQRRYFYPHLDLRPDEVSHLTQVDGVARAALVVERAGELIAVGRYDRLDDGQTAEVAFVVADTYQHHGLATLLFDRLVNTARSAGITHFVAEVLAENRAMLSVFRNAGLPIESKSEWDTVELTMSIVPDGGDAASAQTGTRQTNRVPPDWPG
jgi:RimJ/RimL family protein N-acetyltransferase